ncbi:MAG: hypothetical protein HY925_08735 [Elusimicrobia bacterium]|nr:hypothetical protein [Elusimicrobiota bacterium]
MWTEGLDELFDRCAGAAFDKELAMLERWGAGLWTGDRERGRIRKDGWEQPAQFLGCETDCGSRWTWGWAYGGAPEDSLAGARKMRDYGRLHEYLGLIVPSFELEGRCGHRLAMISSVILGAEFYVECETEEGSLYFASTRRPPPVPADPVARVFRVFPALVSHPDCGVTDQKRAFQSYLEHYGFTHETWKEAKGELVCGKLEGTRRMLFAGFDEQNRAIGLAEASRKGRGGARESGAV